MFRLEPTSPAKGPNLTLAVLVAAHRKRRQQVAAARVAWLAWADRGDSHGRLDWSTDETGDASRQAADATAADELMKIGLAGGVNPLRLPLGIRGYVTHRDFHRGAASADVVCHTPDAVRRPNVKHCEGSNVSALLRRRAPDGSVRIPSKLAAVVKSFLAEGTCVPREPNATAGRQRTTVGFGALTAAQWPSRWSSRSWRTSTRAWWR